MIIQKFEQWLRGLDHAAKTVENYVKDVILFVNWHRDTSGDEFNPSAFNEFELSQYKSYLLTVKRLKPSSINRKIQALRKFGDFLIANGYLMTNPAEKLRQVKDARSNLSPEALNKKEVFKLRKTVHMYGKIRDIVILELMLNTGLRLSEVANLRVSDVEISQRKGVVRVWGKGSKYREIPINSDLRKLIIQYLDQKKD